MGDIPPSVFNAPHDSCAACAWCQAMFVPRVRRGPNQSRFCQPACKDAFWNEKKQNPPGTKISRVLSIFASGQSLNRFQAEKAAHDHALNSTVAEIHNRLGIRVSRKYEIFQFRGKPARVRRYWLKGQAIKRAVRYLEHANKEARP